jgi:hypothetical protein
VISGDLGNDAIFVLPSPCAEHGILSTSDVVFKKQGVR